MGSWATKSRHQRVALKNLKTIKINQVQPGGSRLLRTGALNTKRPSLKCQSDESALYFLVFSKTY
jgi:hypothetical protein